MPSTKHWLENYEKINGGKIVMRNNVCRVKGIRLVTLKFENRYIYTLERVRHAFELYMLLNLTGI